MKLFSLALLAAVASAVAVPGDDWKAWKCPDCPPPVTTTVVKEIKYPPVTVTSISTVISTYKTTVTTTVTSTYNVPCPQKTDWKDW